MKLLYDPDTDSLYIDLNDRPGADAHEIADGVVLDLDATGRPVGIDIQRASRSLDLSTLETRSLPTRIVKLAGTTVLRDKPPRPRRRPARR